MKASGVNAQLAGRLSERQLALVSRETASRYLDRYHDIIGEGMEWKLRGLGCTKRLTADTVKVSLVFMSELLAAMWREAFIYGMSLCSVGRKPYLESLISKGAPGGCVPPIEELLIPCHVEAGFQEAANRLSLKTRAALVEGMAELVYKLGEEMVKQGIKSAYLSSCASRLKEGAN